MKYSLRSLMGVGAGAAFRLTGLCIGLIIGGAMTQSSIRIGKSNFADLLLYGLAGLAIGELSRLAWLRAKRETP